MSLDVSVLAVLTGLATRVVFDLVVSNRSIRFGELLKKLQQTKRSEVGRESAIKSLEELKTAGLIDEKSSSVQDWSTYYVTADGLEASRKVSA